MESTPTAPPPPPVSPEELEFKKHGSAVESNPLDFNSWIYLLQTADKVRIMAARATNNVCFCMLFAVIVLRLCTSQLSIDHVRRSYEAFFEEFPLCYGFWKKVSSADDVNVANDNFLVFVGKSMLRMKRLRRGKRC